MASRRALLQQLGLLAGSVLIPACGRPPAPAAPVNAGPTPLRLPPLHELLTSASLVWIVLSRPKEFTQIAQLAEGLQHLVPDSRRALFEHSSGINLDRVENGVIASYTDSTVFLLDGVSDPLDAERRYRERLSTDVVRSVRRHDLVVVRGKSAAGEKRSLAALGKETVAIESGGWLHTRVAALYAEGKLRRTPRALEIPDVRLLLERVGDAPLIGIAPGPFEGEWKQGLHGLLGVSTAGLASARPLEGGTIQAQFYLAGDWGKESEGAVARLAASWEELAQSSVGRLTGLDSPIESPRTLGDARVIGLTVPVDGAKLLNGLHAAVSAEARDIMRL